MSTFRASPWVQYDPTLASHQTRQRPPDPPMDQDVDMDAPQISILREEHSPPPPPSKKPTLIIRKKGSSKPRIHVEPPVMDAEMAPPDVEDQEDEEDQLIDDDDNGVPRPSSTGPTSGRAVETSGSPKKKITPKRKPRKSDKKLVEEDGKPNENSSQPMGAQIPAPTMSCFKATPTKSHMDAEIMNTEIPAPVDSPSKAKKVSPKKPPTLPRPKIKLPKQKSAIPNLLDDNGVLSESYAGTAASSPITAPFEHNTPEPENMIPSSPLTMSVPLAEEFNLENVPIPVYPLPTKPFLVQPPPKISAGIAPLLPLDKSGKKPRHWREAKREIRGIAGGRWLARTWVGDKDSEYASYVASNNVNHSQPKHLDDRTTGSAVTLPKLPSISAPGSGPRGAGKLKVSSKTASVATSAAPSRAPSVIPEPQGISITSTVRAPTKMRILQLAPSSEGGDSDMAPPADP